MQTRAWVPLVFVVSLACGGDDTEDPRCRQAPTFTRDVAPIADGKCVGCHAPGAARQGAPEALNFDTWASVRPNVEAFADAITSGLMPPLTAPVPVTPEERNTVSLWRTCGFRE